MTIPLPPLPEPDVSWSDGGPSRSTQQMRSIQREAMRVALEAAAQAAGPDDSYQDEWFAAKADAVKRIRALVPMP